ncbi:preprotein translocase subunit SecG [Priestia aryabhattai]|jgi:hypothetical protein
MKKSYSFIAGLFIILSLLVNLIWRGEAWPGYLTFALFLILLVLFFINKKANNNN